jgi:hypothetical protein
MRALSVRVAQLIIGAFIVPGGLGQGRQQRATWFLAGGRNWHGKLLRGLDQPGMRAIDEIAAGTDDKNWRSRRNLDLVHLFISGASCMFCKEKKEKERTLRGVLEDVRGEMKFRAALENSGLCLWHGQLAVTGWKVKSARDWIAGIIRNRMEELAKDLQEFVRKHDYQRRTEAPGRKQDSVDRARQSLLGTGALMGNQL